MGPGSTDTVRLATQTDMPSPRFFRTRKFCPRPVLRILRVFLLIFVFSSFVVFVFHRPHSSDAIRNVDTFRQVDDLLDEALHVSLSYDQNYQDGRPRASPRGADTYPSRASLDLSPSRFPLVSSALPVQVDLGSLRAQACQILRGKSILLVGPHETLFQLHSYLLTVLHPDPILGSTIAPTMRPSCLGSTLSYSCPSHPLCYPTKSPPRSSFHSGNSGFSSGSDTIIDDYESPPAFQSTTISSSSSSSSGNGNGGTGSLLRFINSGNLNPSPTQEDVARFSVPFVDPRTGVRVIDSRWVRYAASSKADILVLNRGPLPAPAWSYNTKNGSNLTWLTTLRALEKVHAEPLSDLFADVLSRLDHHHHHHHHHDDDHLITPPPSAAAQPDDTTKLIIDAALHSTISTFLPSLLSTLSRLLLRGHAGHRRTILGGTMTTGKKINKPVLWYGSWFLPVSCAPDSLSIFSSSSGSSSDSESDPRHLLTQLLTQAEATNNPWSAYYNAQGPSYVLKLACTALLASPCLL